MEVRVYFKMVFMFICDFLMWGIIPILPESQAYVGGESRRKPPLPP